MRRGVHGNPAAVAGQFSPASLFGASDAGVVFDNADITKLFTDTGATTPVATAGDFTAAWKDIGPLAKNATQATASLRPQWHGKPTALGAEQITNPNFAADTDWAKGTGWTISGGVATKAAGVASNLTISVPLVAGTLYRVFFYITRTAGTLNYRFTGGTTINGTPSASRRSMSGLLIAQAGNTTFELVADAAFAGTVKRVSIKPATALSHYYPQQPCGTSDQMATASVDMSGSHQATVMILADSFTDPANRTAVDHGLVAAVSGGWALGPSTIWQVRVRDSTNTPIVQSATETFSKLFGDRLYQITGFVNRAGVAVTDQLQLRTRGITPTTTNSGVAVADGALLNRAITFFAFPGGQIRAIVINRILTEAELTACESWLLRGYVRCATLGDSTIAGTNNTFTLPEANYVSAFVAGMYTGTMDMATAGERIADQKARWQALTGKNLLQAVFFQVGQNDCNTYAGISKTNAQIIADLQDLLNTVRADLGPTCKLYICTLTPSRAWLGVANSNAAAAYSAWQAVNQAIMGGGATPITGADAVISGHTTDLNDGSDNLLPLYDMNGDGVHPSNEGREFIAARWRAQLVSDGLLVAGS